MERGVATVAADQVGGRPVLHDAAVVDDDHAVGDLDGGEPVGNDDRGPFGEERLQRALDQTLRRNVE